MGKTTRNRTKVNAYLDGYITPTLTVMGLIISILTGLGIGFSWNNTTGEVPPDEGNSTQIELPDDLSFSQESSYILDTDYLVLKVTNCSGRRCYPGGSFRVYPPADDFGIEPEHLDQFASMDTATGLFAIDIPLETTGLAPGQTITIGFTSQTPMRIRNSANLPYSFKPRFFEQVLWDPVPSMEDSSTSLPLYLAGLGSLTLSAGTLFLSALACIPVLLWISLTDPRKRLARYWESKVYWVRARRKRRKSKTTSSKDG